MELAIVAFAFALWPAALYVRNVRLFREPPVGGNFLFPPPLWGRVWVGSESGGTETMVVRDFTLQGQDKRNLARMEAFDFNVGATLVVAAGQVEGVYSGEFDVTVQYP